MPYRGILMNISDRLENSLIKINDFDSKGDRYGMYCDNEYPYRWVLGGMPILALKRALLAQQEIAVSYRKFNVGVAVAGYQPEYKAMSIFAGANFKVDDTDLINIHAEDIAIGKAIKFGCNVVPLLVVVGETQEDHASGLTTNTLHPCGRCRKMLGQSALVNERTIIISAKPSLDVLEIYNLQQCCDLHEQNDKSGVDYINLRPFEDTGTPELTEWDEDWDTKVSPILAERYYQAEQL